MVYRDDDIAQLQSRLATAEKRLDKFEALYENEGVPEKVTLAKRVGKFFGALKNGVSTFFFDFVLTPFFLIPALVIGAGVGLYFLISSQNEVQEEAQRAAEQALTTQCEQFCGTHGFVFHGDRRVDTCYCGTENSEATSFIIDVNTSEHWTVANDSE